VITPFIITILHALSLVWSSISKLDIFSNAIQTQFTPNSKDPRISKREGRVMGRTERHKSKWKQKQKLVTLYSHMWIYDTSGDIRLRGRVSGSLETCHLLQLYLDIGRVVGMGKDRS